MRESVARTTSRTSFWSACANRPAGRMAWYFRFRRIFGLASEGLEVALNSELMEDRVKHPDDAPGIAAGQPLTRWMMA